MNKEITPDMILTWLKINSGKYIVNTFENDGTEIYHLLDNGTWKETNTWGYYNPAAEPDMNLTFESKVFDSVNEAKAYLEQNGVYIDVFDKIVPLSQIQSYIGTSNKNDYTLDAIAISFDKIPSYEEFIKNGNINNIDVNDLMESIFNEIYDPDTGNEWLQFE